MLKITEKFEKKNYKYAVQLCDNLKLRFEPYPKTEEFKLVVTQDEN